LFLYLKKKDKIWLYTTELLETQFKSYTIASSILCFF